MEKKRNPNFKTPVYAVDLFCGAGGLTHGLQQSGVNVRLGVDLDPSCEYPYSANNQASFLLKSVTELTGDDINKHFDKKGLKLLAGCAPCQTFSTYNPNAKHQDKRWGLLNQFSRLMVECSPDLITMENVPGLAGKPIFKNFQAALNKNGYHVSWSIVNCSDYGVPQTRKRLVLLASKLGEIAILPPNELGYQRVSVRDAIGHFNPLEAGGLDEVDPLHVSSSLSETNLKRIKASKPKGTWKDWPEDLRNACHKKASGMTFGGVYGRMDWDLPSPTITTQFCGFGNGRFGHPVQHRAISLREGAVLQSFPDNYAFVPPESQLNRRAVARLIGNAVPVRLGEVIGETLKRHVNDLAR